MMDKVLNTVFSNRDITDANSQLHLARFQILS